MANLKEIKTERGVFQFEALNDDFLSSNYFAPETKDGNTDNLLKVLVLYAEYGKSELINSLKLSNFEWIGEQEPVYYEFANTKDVLENGGILILDNANWTSQKIEQYIKLFNDSETNPHNVQLLIAVNTIEDMDWYMRADQIFLLDNNNSFPNEKDTLFSISDFDGVTIGFEYSVWYHAGRFGCKLPYDYMKKEVGLI